MEQKTKPIDPSLELLKLCNKTLETANNSCIVLEEQEESLRKSSYKLTGINNNLTHTDKSLNSIESIWWQIVDYFRPEEKVNKEKVSTIVHNQNEKQMEIDKEKQKKLDAIYKKHEVEKKSTIPIIPDSTNSYLQEQDKRLDMIFNTVQDIKLRTQLMSASIDSSTDTIKHISNITDNTTHEVKKQIDKADKILGK